MYLGPHFNCTCTAIVHSIIIPLDVKFMVRCMLEMGYFLFYMYHGVIKAMYIHHQQYCLHMDFVVFYTGYALFLFV